MEAHRRREGCDDAKPPNQEEEIVRRDLSQTLLQIVYAV